VIANQKLDLVYLVYRSCMPPQLHCLQAASFIIIIIITNAEIIVAFSPRTIRTRYKVKNKTARYVVSLYFTNI